MPIYKNSDMLALISEYCHNLKYQDVLRLRYCNGHTYEEIGEITGYSTQHVKHICKTYKTVLFNLL